ncbi:MAG: formylglycine-generating enzyme family protein [bacterium]
MILVPAGEFLMGSPPAEKGRDPDSDWPAHRVIMEKPLYIGKYEITQAHWIAVMGQLPLADPDSQTQQAAGNNYPVANMNWVDASDFCNRLSELFGLKPVYRKNHLSTDYQANGFRMPAEAEWEYACRAGTTTRFSHGNVLECEEYGCQDCEIHERYMWWCGNSGGTVMEVGLKLPNPWGFFDMHGNVSEICTDPYYHPDGSDDGYLQGQIIRGGNFALKPVYCRSAHREQIDPVTRSRRHGFRLALPVSGASSVDRWERAK